MWLLIYLCVPVFVDSIKWCKVILEILPRSQPVLRGVKGKLPSPTEISTSVSTCYLLRLEPGLSKALCPEQQQHFQTCYICRISGSVPQSHRTPACTLTRFPGNSYASCSLSFSLSVSLSVCLSLTHTQSLRRIGLESDSRLVVSTWGWVVRCNLTSRGTFGKD